MDPLYDQVDASLFRNFPIWERLKLTLRLDAFNAINHPILGTPASTATTTSTNFGVITGVAGQNTQRLMQISGKLQF